MCEEPLPGFKPSVPVVFCGLFPIDANDFSDLREALEKLSLMTAHFHLKLRHLLHLDLGSMRVFRPAAYGGYPREACTRI